MLTSDFYQRIFKDNQLKPLDDYSMPSSGQLSEFRLNRDQASRCKAINVLQYNVQDQGVNVELGLQKLSLIQNRSEMRKSHARAL